MADNSKDCARSFGYRVLADTKDYDMKTEKMKMKLLCEKLNAHLPCKSQQDVDALNNLINEMRNANPDSGLYFDREIFIDANFNNELMRKITMYSGKVQFEPSNDPTEHPGVVVRYKEEYKTGR